MAPTNDVPAGESTFIQKYFSPLAKDFPGALGLSDDAATVDVGAGFDLVVTVDAVAEGVHFFAGDSAADIGWRALAVNVSDLTAKGAEPVAYVMSIAFPERPSDAWMTEFCSGLGAAQTVFKLHLAGGDTDVRPGPLSITITALGRVPKGALVRRGGGEAGDRLFLTGTIGDASAGLALRHDPSEAKAWRLEADHRDFLLNRYGRPKPRTRLAPVLQRHARAAIDISDGLVKDAAALARASGTGLEVHCARLPISEAARIAVAAGGMRSEDLITGGGDYEVLAAIASADCTQFAESAEGVGVAVTEIGTLTARKEIAFLGPYGQTLRLEKPGYDHFDGTDEVS